MDLIDREQAIEAIRKLCLHYTDTKSVYHPHIDFVIEEIEKLPSAEKTGRWTIGTESRFRPFMCSACGCIYDVDTNTIGEPVWKYCPNCGARMED